MYPLNLNLQRSSPLRGIDTVNAILPLKKSDVTQPDAGRLITALRQIGYSLEQAIADLVDNSINAGARTVLIRFLHDGESITAVALVDDGEGMSEAGLYDAMRFGSRESSVTGTLGKFGMGLKLASLSHARNLQVYTRKQGKVAGRRWTPDGITQGWWCERIHKRATADLLNRKWGPIDLTENGTCVLWEDLDKLPSHRNGLKYTLTSIDTRLRLHLGLCFHRFLEEGSLRLLIDQQLNTRIGQGISSEIAPLNPFAYSVSGHRDYPKKLSVVLNGVGELKIEGHIWPAKSDAPEYRLGRRSAARQGFYFYRNGRLIQAGGWNGVIHDETEPHSSLARVKVDLPVSLDEDFGLNVQKSSVLVPSVFAEILKASASDGTTFEDYRRIAIQTYRTVNLQNEHNGRFPSSGLQKNILKQLRSAYAKPEEIEGFRIAWRQLNANEFFRIDVVKQQILVNRQYRDSKLSETVKLLLAVFLRNDVNNSVRRARLFELQELNRLLLESISKN